MRNCLSTLLKNMACVEAYFCFEAFSMESSQHKYLANVSDSNGRRRCGAGLAPNTKHYVGYELCEPSTGNLWNIS